MTPFCSFPETISSVCRLRPCRPRDGMGGMGGSFVFTLWECGGADGPQTTSQVHSWLGDPTSRELLCAGPFSVPFTFGTRSMSGKINLIFNSSSSSLFPRSRRRGSSPSRTASCGGALGNWGICPISPLSMQPTCNCQPLNAVRGRGK